MAEERERSEEVTRRAGKVIRAIGWRCYCFWIWDFFYFFLFFWMLVFTFGDGRCNGVIRVYVGKRRKESERYQVERQC